MVGDCGRCGRNSVWPVFGSLDPGAARRQSTNAGNRRRDPGRRPRLPQSPVHDHRGSRGRAVLRARLFSGLADRRRLRHRRDSLRVSRLHRHVHLGTRQRAHRAGSAQWHQCCAAGRVSWRRDHRHAGRRLRAPRRCRLFPRDAAAARRYRFGAALARGACVWRIADLDLCASRRWHFHQGCRCRRGSRRQGRSRHSRG